MKYLTQPSWVPGPIPAMQKADWTALALVLALAVALRLFFYTGFFGSDEVTYVEAALNIATGDWRASNYIGSIRYGMNLPVALSIYLFGLSEANANLWPFLCSIGEVAVVFAIARWLWSIRVAVVSAGLLALLPLHVHFAGRMMADPPLAFFLTLSVLLLLCAAHSRRPLTYIAAGLTWGGVFWVKESVALLYLPVFLFLSILLNRFNPRWLWLFAGMGTSVAANCLLMYLVTGNPMHVLAVIGEGLRNYDGMVVETSPWFYFRYLFLDIRHTLLLGSLATCGVVLYAKRDILNKEPASGTQFVVLWALLLVGMFSFAIASFVPVKLVMKQTNYMLIFSGPLALLAGWFLASIPSKIGATLGALVVCGSVLLAALEQQAIQVFTANSRAAYVFLRDRPSAYLVGTTNNQQAINFFSMMEDRWEMRNRISTISEMASEDPVDSVVPFSSNAAGKEIFFLLDLQNIDWGNSRSTIRRLSDVPKCWVAMGILTPAALGSGRFVVQGLVAAGIALPESLRQRYMSILQPVSSPLHAYLYRVDHSCLI